MNIEEVREYCIAKPGVTEEFPFDSDTLVFKVMGKAFVFTSLTFLPFRVNLKMDAELVGEYRDKYVDVQPGYHMNKKYWNSVNFEKGAVPRKELLWMIDHSYEQVVKGLTKKLQEELKTKKR
ncbi:MAG TPA: MmcQ/YjbR family DNA-binding protein [Chitinophagales bacterium]|nr:MmcQ/YjbR family DNA-binding protein [Chitinophagales bacterium]